MKLSKLQIDEVDFYNNKLEELQNVIIEKDISIKKLQKTAKTHKEELFSQKNEVDFYKVCLNEKDVILEINYN